MASFVCALDSQIMNDFICCGTGELIINVTNPYGEQNYTITYQGISFSQVIPANSSKTFSLMMPVECNSAANVEVSVSSPTEAVLLKKSIPVRVCPAVNIALVNSISTCPNTISELPIQVINPSSTAQAYHISFDKKSE